jgi:hypothetical protein
LISLLQFSSTEANKKESWLISTLKGDLDSSSSYFHRKNEKRELIGFNAFIYWYFHEVNLTTDYRYEFVSKKTRVGTGQYFKFIKGTTYIWLVVPYWLAN